ncbi:MAG: Gfo/Idh/MocA family protein [Thermoguttaceae bacterium]|jgi:hypothetical protein
MSQKPSPITRRRFLTAAAFAAPLVVSGRVLGLNNAVSPSNKLVTALIGHGNRGNEILIPFATEPDFHMLGVCDCYEVRAQEGKNRLDQQFGNHDALIFPKYEDILDRDDVDVVICACPDHWHTKIIVESCKAGKDVFCEKPLTLTLAEGRMVVKAARKYNRVVSSGSQRVIEDYGKLAPIVQSGDIGEVKEIFCGVGGPPSQVYLPEEEIPVGFDWDRWLGQTPWMPYNPSRCSGSYGGGWRRIYEYGNGFLADWGAHKFGGAAYACGLDGEEPVKVLQPHSGGNETDYMTVEYANGVQLHHAPEHDITIVGAEGCVHTGNAWQMVPSRVVNIRCYHGAHECIRPEVGWSFKRRVRPFQDVQFGANVAAICQLMNIGYQVRRDLVWDSENTRFIGDDEANRLVSRVQRAPYTIEI